MPLPPGSLWSRAHSITKIGRCRIHLRVLEEMPDLLFGDQKVVPQRSYKRVIAHVRIPIPIRPLTFPLPQTYRSTTNHRMCSQSHSKTLLLTSFYVVHALYHLPCCAARETSTNRTIDDSYGDLITGFIPKYSPRDQWSQGTPDNNCCLDGTVRPDNLSQLHNGTWHQTQLFSNISDTVPTVTIQFTGTAVYVFNALANYFLEDSLTLATNITFSLDGENVGVFLHIPSSTEFQYNVPVYTNQSLGETAVG